MFQLVRSRWKSAVAITSSATGGEGPDGGHARRNARNLLQSSVLYIDADRFGRSIKLQKKEDNLMLHKPYHTGSKCIDVPNENLRHA